MSHSQVCSCRCDRWPRYWLEVDSRPHLWVRWRILIRALLIRVWLKGKLSQVTCPDARLLQQQNIKMFTSAFKETLTDVCRSVLCFQSTVVIVYSVWSMKIKGLMDVTPETVKCTEYFCINVFFFVTSMIPWCFLIFLKSAILPGPLILIPVSF